MNVPPAPAGQQTTNEPRWASLLAKMLLPAMLFALSMPGILASAAKAQPVTPAHTSSLLDEP